VPRKHFRKFLPDGDTVRDHKYLAWLGTWLHHPNLWHLNRDSVAGAVAIGLFALIVLPHLDLLFGNRDELARVTGAEDPPRMAAHLRELGVGTVAVKLGEDGAYVDGGNWRGRVPAFSVEVVDTTGAGDAFCGGFLTGYLAGWDLERTTRFANAVGAMCVTAMGGSTGISGMDETLHFMDTASLRT